MSKLFKSLTFNLAMDVERIFRTKILLKVQGKNKCLGLCLVR